MRFNDSNVSLKLKASDGIDMEITCDEVMRQCLAMRLVCRELSPLLSWIAWTSAITSTSTKMRIARDQGSGTPWAQRNGLNFFAHLSPCRICVYHRNYGCSSLRALTGERATKVLPDLQTLSFERFQPPVYVAEGLEPSVTTRQLSSHPVAPAMGGPRLRLGRATQIKIGRTTPKGKYTEQYHSESRRQRCPMTSVRWAAPLRSEMRDSEHPRHQGHLVCLPHPSSDRLRANYLPQLTQLESADPPILYHSPCSRLF